MGEDACFNRNNNRRETSSCIVQQRPDQTSPEDHVVKTLQVKVAENDAIRANGLITSRAPFAEKAGITIVVDDSAQGERRRKLLIIMTTSRF